MTNQGANVREVSVTRDQLELLDALNKNAGQQYLPELRYHGKLGQVVVDTLWARTASALVRKGLLVRGKRYGRTVYQLSEFGQQYMACWVAGQDGVLRWQPPSQGTWRECENGSRVSSCYHNPRCGPLRPDQAVGLRPFGRYVPDTRT